MQKPFFSIVIVSLNPGEKLKKTLDSILKQSFADVQVIVKDGLSSDGSLTALEQRGYFENYPQLELIRRKDKGIYDAMNQALESVRGQYIQFLNCGDYLPEDDTLQKTADFIRANAGAEIYYGNQFNRLQNTVVSSPPTINDFTCYRNVPCHQLCFYADRLFAKRGYDVTYKIRADYEHFLYCIYEEKAKALAMSHLAASYEGGGFSETAENRKLSAAEHRVICKKYLGTVKTLKFRSIMLLTLAPLRTKIAESPRLSKYYNYVKSFVYRKIRK